MAPAAFTPTPAGAFNRALVLERRTSVTNPDSEPVATWVPWKTVGAKIEPLRGKQRYVGARIGEEVTTRITIRYTPKIDAVRVRGVYGGQVYQFDTVLDPELAHRELWIDAVVRN
jgi:SPP1 family predicted phage head-tail adaptor